MKNHYNALELDKNCTTQEIKDSYIKLSKKYHPDKNNTEDAKKKIVEINEAYSVLKNASTRNAYDEKLKRDNMQQRRQQNFHQNSQQNSHKNHGEYYYNRTRSYDEYVRYYQKMSNGSAREFVTPKGKFAVVICCCMLMMFGAGLRLMYAWSEAFRRRQINEERARRIESMSKDTENPQLENFKAIWKRALENDIKRRKSES